MPTTVSTVLLTIKGECRKANLSLNALGKLELSTLQKYMKKKEEPEEIASYTIIYPSLDTRKERREQRTKRSYLFLILKRLCLEML
jgi:hypothetical protein